MPKWQLNHLPDKGHLLPAASNVIVAYIISLLLVFSFNRFTLGKEQSLRYNDTVFTRLSGNNLKLNRLEGSFCCEKVSFFNWAVSIFEIWENVGLGQIPSNALNCVLEGQNVYFS